MTTNNIIRDALAQKTASETEIRTQHEVHKRIGRDHTGTLVHSGKKKT